MAAMRPTVMRCFGVVISYQEDAGREMKTNFIIRQFVDLCRVMVTLELKVEVEVFTAQGKLPDDASKRARAVADITPMASDGTSHLRLQSKLMAK